MARKNNWETAFIEYIDLARDIPFAWGTHDCGLFACEVVKILTGFDVASKFIGYTDEKGAMLSLRKYAGGGILEACTQMGIEGGFKIIEPLFAQRGDILVINHNGIDSFAVCIGSALAVVHPEKGFVTFPMGYASTAWRIE